MIDGELGRVTGVGIGEEGGVRRVQENGLRSEGLSQVFESVGRFSREVLVDFAEVMYGCVCVSLFFSWDSSLSL